VGDCLTRWVTWLVTGAWGMLKGRVTVSADRPRFNETNKRDHPDSSRALCGPCPGDDVHFDWPILGPYSTLRTVRYLSGSLRTTLSNLFTGLPFANHLSFYIRTEYFYLVRVQYSKVGRYLLTYLP